MELDIVVIGGVSGSGKSVALGALEDAGYFTVNNLPLPLLKDLVRHLGESGFTRIGVTVDPKSGAALAMLPAVIEALRKLPARVRFIFLDAKVETLVKRFSETRRRHPLSSAERTLREAIEFERTLVGDGVDRTVAATVADAANGNLERARLLARDPDLARRRDAFASAPRRLDGTGRAVVTLSTELFGLIDAAAAPLAARLGIGMITVRKAGKLPGPVIGVDYQLEYGTARMELRPDTVHPADRILVVDDVLATGGTAAASVELIERAGGQVAGIVVLMELLGLNGRSRLDGYEVETVLAY